MLEGASTPSPPAELEKLVSATQCLKPFTSAAPERHVTAVVWVGSASTRGIGRRDDYNVSQEQFALGCVKARERSKAPREKKDKLWQCRLKPP